MWGLKYNASYLPSPTTTVTTLEDVSNAGTNEYTLAFGTRISYETPTGAYNKALTLSAIVNPIPEDKIMQNYTYAQCETNAADGDVVLADIRDGKSYTVRYIDGACWMTQNLAYDLATNNTLSPETTNVENVTTISTVGDLTSGNTYTEARIHIPTEENLTSTKLTTEANGYWYNYCAATAGEVCSDSSMDEATIDICPASWKIPSDIEWNSIGGDGSYSTTYVDQFSPVAAGLWVSSTVYAASVYGYWWSTTAHSATYRYYLSYIPSRGLHSGNSNVRGLGLPVRCMLAN